MKAKPRFKPKKTTQVELTTALQEALRLHQLGHLDQAAISYRKIVAIQPNHFDALHLLGIVRSQQDHHLEANDLIRQALKLNPQAAAAWFNLGMVLSRLDRHDKALEAFDSALTIQPDNAEVLNNRGNTLFVLKRPEQALASYDKALAIRPGFADALNNRGNALRILGRAQEAVESYNRALAIRPDYFDAFNSRGNALKDLQRLPEALESYEKSLALRPDFADALNNRGTTLRELHRPQDALDSFDKALAIRSDFADALNNRGNALFDLHRVSEALESYEKSLVLHPNFAGAFNNRGNALKSLNRLQEALESYDNALVAQSDFAEAHFNRGNVLFELHRLPEALESFDKALAIRTNFAGALNNRGNVLRALNRLQEATESYDMALAIQCDFADALNNRGCALKDLQRKEEALADFDQALALRPDFANALFNRGVLLKDLKRHDEALVNLDKVLALQPHHEHALSEIACSAAMACNWGRGHIAADLREHIDKRISIIEPFVALGYCADAALLKTCSESFVQFRTATALMSFQRAKPTPRDKIKIAYVSSDFREHAVAYLTAELFELHDRDRFEIVAASFGSDDRSPIRSRLENAFDEFHDLKTKSDADVAKLLANLEIDIAVDLNGHTAGGRPGILALRPAPVQVSFLGFPGTNGAAFIDYTIADDFLIPAASHQYYSEKIAYLPDCFQPNDRKRPIAERTPRREECNLPEDGFVFCSFNNSYKLNPDVFDVWMRLLTAVPKSVLWLSADNKFVVENLRHEARARGVPAERLVFADRVAPPDYLARMRLADLCLDTWPFNAGTTASDALWAGLPIVTFAGQTLAGRMAGSILTAIGLPDLVTHSVAEYEALAAKLATHPAELAEVRRRLGTNRNSYPLFDTPRFIRNLEAAYSKMWSTYLKGEAPRTFRVGAVG